MSVLTSEQTTRAVRGLIYFGAHDFNGPLDLVDCTAEITSVLETLTASAHETAPVNEEVRVQFNRARHNEALIRGQISVVAHIQWPSVQERMRQGSPHYRIISQPNVSQTDLTRNFLIAFSRIIAKHNDAVRRFRDRYAEAANAPTNVNG